MEPELWRPRKGDEEATAGLVEDRLGGMVERAMVRVPVGAIERMRRYYYTHPHELPDDQFFVHLLAAAVGEETLNNPKGEP